MSETEETVINPDGTFETPPGAEDAGGSGGFEGGFEGAEQEAGEDFEMPPIDLTEKGGVDPAVYFVLFIAALVFLYYFFVLRKKKDESEDDFFSNLDGDKVSTSRWRFFLSVLSAVLGR